MNWPMDIGTKIAKLEAKKEDLLKKVDKIDKEIADLKK